MGRSAFDAIFQSVTIMDSSPRRETITRPVTNTWSPRSTRDFHSDRDSSPTSASDSIAWMRLPSVPPCRVAKHSLPVLRTNTTRPPTCTTRSVSSPAFSSSAASFGSYSARRSSMWLGSTRLPSESSRPTGYASRPDSISFARFSRRICICSDISAIAGAAVCSVLTVIPICVVCWGLF